MGKPNDANKKKENIMLDSYKAIEHTVTSGYKAIENGVVNGYKKIEDGFVRAFLTDGDKPESDPNTEKEDSEG